MKASGERRKAAALPVGQDKGSRLFLGKISRQSAVHIPHLFCHKRGGVGIYICTYANDTLKGDIEANDQGCPGLGRWGHLGQGEVGIHPYEG
jgi:hypothetical protein